MGIVELLLIAVGLSMDAFAVSICRGLGMRRLNLRTAAVLALFFGGFQALMPLIGWALGSQFMWLIGPVDHWVAFVLLAFIGGKMLWEAFHEEDEGCDCEDTGAIDLREFLILAVATSIDALASSPLRSRSPEWRWDTSLGRAMRSPRASWGASCSS